jgi:hypothetical protein
MWLPEPGHTFLENWIVFDARQRHQLKQMDYLRRKQEQASLRDNSLEEISHPYQRKRPEEAQ